MSSVQGIHDTDTKNVRAISGMKASHLTLDGGGSGNTTLLHTYPPVILLDPGGGAVDCLLPAEALSDGLMFFIINTADAVEAITVKEDSDTTTILTLDQNQGGWVVCDGTTWRGFMGGIT